MATLKSSKQTNVNATASKIKNKILSESFNNLLYYELCVTEGRRLRRIDETLI